MNVPLQIIQEVFCWSRQFAEVRRLAQRKEAIYMELLCQHKPMLSLGVRSLLSALQMHQAQPRLSAVLLPLTAAGQEHALPSISYR